MTTYRGYRISYDPPPIPVRTCDWGWWNEQYDGPGDSRHGFSASLEAAKAAIDEQIAEREDDDGMHRHVQGGWR